MAKYSIVVDVSEDAVIKTLTFNGKEYTEKWTDNGFCCEYPLVEVVKHDYPDMPATIIEMIDDLSSFSDTQDMIEFMHEIQEYESSLSA